LQLPAQSVRAIRAANLTALYYASLSQRLYGR
jgi:hypothetical protein